MTWLGQVLAGLKNAWDKTIGRLLVTLLVTAVKGYQRWISPLRGPTCRYYPTCSAYALQALRTHGAGKGSMLTVARLVRCNPWSHGGIDFVPERGRWRGSHEVRPTARPVGSK
ncbi:MAG: membrane protein insertion efficiency factor YidD [Candidatus Nanopelagicales bacterium]